MVAIFAGILLGCIVLFFILAFATGAIIFIVPVVMLAVVLIQIFLKIRDEVLDNRSRKR